jgi:hypothetical protein
LGDEIRAFSAADELAKDTGVFIGDDDVDARKHTATGIDDLPSDFCSPLLGVCGRHTTHEGNDEHADGESEHVSSLKLPGPCSSDDGQYVL